MHSGSLALTIGETIKTHIIIHFTSSAVTNNDHFNNNNNNNNKSVVTNQGGMVTMLWNQQVQTDRTIPNNKPGIIIRDNEKGTCILIDVAIPGDRNVIKRSREDFKI